MKTIAAFNNKGGVGKTTLTCNIASYFARAMRQRVLVIDCDPQCNATQLILGQDAASDLYWNSSSAQSNETTIRDILQPIEDGDSGISDSIQPFISSRNRFNVDVIAGHPGLSIIEDRLGGAWHDLLGGDLGGIRKTNWNLALCEKLSPHYDYCFIDLGPSLGSINRSVLVGCDSFFTPMGSDIFSILGVRNISAWLQQWTAKYENGLKLAESNQPGRLDNFSISRKLSIKNGYVGYTMQQYITKAISGERRPTKAYDEIITCVPDEIKSSLQNYFPSGMTLSDANLGDVPHLFSLIPLAQSAASPIIDLQSSDGLVGAQYKQREQFGEIIQAVAAKMMNNLSKV
ncbi:MAG: ParA family protein [Planctomycetia bacterium]|nr:ParA family protein [Planctomycetia bacterium]